jgi:hypothetical protein
VIKINYISRNKASYLQISHNVCSNENTWTMDMVSMFLKLWHQSSFLLVHQEDATDIFILNLLTQDGILQTCTWDSGVWNLAVSSAVLTKTCDGFSHSTHTNADFVPGLDYCHSPLNTFLFITHYSYDAHTYT